MMEAIFKRITDEMIAKLEDGVVPWHKPWTSQAPANAISRKPYRGVNRLVLGLAGFTCPYWVTYRQAQQLGGHVKKGEHGQEVVLWKWLEKKVETKDAKTGETTVKTERYPWMTGYRVFNLEQTTVDRGRWPVVAVADNNPIAACEAIVNNMPQRPRINHVGDGAYYNPGTDAINMPPMATFETSECYYDVLFHELVHSTGHRSRLNRTMGTMEFSGEAYSQEELVAEMGGAFLAAITGIERKTLDNSAAYIGSWLKKLRNDTKLVVYAASQAEKAVQFITGDKV